MASRWVRKDADALAELKILVRNEIAARPQYPDVVGDRRLLRFIRGKQYNIQEAAKMYTAFLNWRDENNVDDIRNQILFGGLDSPYKFPNGKKIIDLAPQIVISAKAQDKKGQPLVLEQYSFSPADMLARVTVKDYLQFLIYSLEYRALVMEQLSHEREQQYLTAHPNPEQRAEGYGVVMLFCCIRDLQGVGLSHLTGKGKAIIEAAINIGLPNYPEYLGKCHMINVPWVFTSMWYFIKGLLDEYILAKISFASSNYMDTLLKDIPMESIPKALGGKFYQYNESFAFDTSPTGPFHTEHKRRVSAGGSAGTVNAAPATTNNNANATTAATSAATPATTAVTTTPNQPGHAIEPAVPAAEAPPSADSVASLSPSPALTHPAAKADTPPVAAAEHRVMQTTAEESLSTLAEEESTVLSKPALTARGPVTTSATTRNPHLNGQQSSGTGSTHGHSSHTVGATPETVRDVADKDVVASVASTVVTAVIASPVAAAVGTIVVALFLAAPWLTVKYVIVPLLFILFVVYVI